MSQKAISQLAKSRDIDVQDALDQILSELVVIDMNVRISIPEHIKPSSLVNKVVEPVGFLQDGARRSRRSKRGALILKQTFEELPAQLKLKIELID